MHLVAALLQRLDSHFGRLEANSRRSAFSSTKATRVSETTLPSATERPCATKTTSVSNNTMLRQSRLLLPTSPFAAISTAFQPAQQPQSPVLSFGNARIN
mmetsp:Transcript_15522/g.25117  ORF Transcript_15522/g.25117 Transcript_15522/m.25117 type:complete len:100 (-) Transcript_15522:18-317(-)